MAVILAPVFASGDPATYRSTAQLLTFLASQARGCGQLPLTPATVYIGSLDTVTGQAGGRSVWTVNQLLLGSGVQCTREQVTALITLADRYRRLVHYVREVWPVWRKTGSVEYADNSVEMIETNRWGGTRRRMALAPHGDLCY
jgi:hypothetical protein